MKRGTALNGVWKPFDCPQLNCSDPTPSSPPSAERLPEGQGTPLWVFVLGILVVGLLPLLKVSKTSSPAIFFPLGFFMDNKLVLKFFLVENDRLPSQLLEVWTRQDSEHQPHRAQLRHSGHP